MSDEQTHQDCCIPFPKFGFKKRKASDATFIFIGFRDAGKSTAIQNIFKASNSSKIEDEEIITEISTERNVRIVEFKGFKSHLCIEHNAQILASINCYLETTKPTILFITAKLNDSRFVGDWSEFSMYLKALKSLNLDSNTVWSDAILLLTNADRPDIKDTVKIRIANYKRIFNNIFQVDPVCVWVGDSQISADEIQEQMRETGSTNNISLTHSYFLSYLRSIEDKYIRWENRNFKFTAEQKEKVRNSSRSFAEILTTLA